MIDFSETFSSPGARETLIDPPLNKINSTPLIAFRTCKTSTLKPPPIKLCHSTSSNSSSSISSISSPLVETKSENSYSVSKDPFDFEDESDETCELFSDFKTSPVPQEQTNSTFYNKISPLIKKSVFRSSETRNPTRHSLLEMSFNFESIKNSDNDEESFEEESLIDRQKPEKDENFDDSVFLKNKSKCNIVETIDPTFKQTKSSLQSKFSSVEMKASSAMSKGL